MTCSGGACDSATIHPIWRLPICTSVFLGCTFSFTLCHRPWPGEVLIVAIPIILVKLLFTEFRGILSLLKQIANIGNSLRWRLPHHLSKRYLSSTNPSSNYVLDWGVGGGVRGGWESRKRPVIHSRRLIRALFDFEFFITQISSLFVLNSLSFSAEYM